MAEEANVTLATIHLVVDVKLWWRSKYMNIKDGLFYCGNLGELNTRTPLLVLPKQCRHNRKKVTVLL